MEHRTQKDDKNYYDYQSADSAIKFLNAYDRPEPFFRQIGFYTPQGPNYTPVRCKEMYNTHSFRKPEVCGAGFDENAYTENSIVVLLSNHGFHLDNEKRFRKEMLLEQVASVPMSIFDPAHSGARKVADPVALLDVGPTVVSCTGLPPMENCAGQSMRPLVKGQSTPERAIPTFHYDDVFLRKGDFRLTRHKDGSTLLYNLGQGHPAFAQMYCALTECAQSFGPHVPRLKAAG